VHREKGIPKSMPNMMPTSKELTIVSNGTLLQGKQKMILKQEAF
jgi:hypothetical protein